MHIHYFQKLFLFICLFFMLPSAGKDIFVEFAQALEVAAEPISKIIFDLSQKELASQLSLKKDWNLDKKLSDDDYQKVIMSWQKSKDKNKLEIVWNNQRTQEPQSNLKKSEIKTKLESTLHKIRNVTEPEAFKDVKPPTKELEHKKNIASYTIALNQAYKNFDNATNDDLHKINYFINQADNILNNAQKSETYEKLKKQHEKKEKPIEEKKEAEPQKTIEEKEYDSLKKELLNLKAPDDKKIQAITKDLLSIQEKLYYESGVPYLKSPHDSSPVAFAKKWLDTSTKKFKAWQTNPGEGSDLWNLWVAGDGILSKMRKIASDESDTINKEKKNILKIKELETKEKGADIGEKNTIQHELYLKKGALKGKDIIQDLFGLGVPRLGQILSARANDDNLQGFRQSIEVYYAPLSVSTAKPDVPLQQESIIKQSLLSLLKEISFDYNKERLSTLLIRLFSEDVSLKNQLEAETNRFKAIDKKFADELLEDLKDLSKTLEAEKKWKEAGSKPEDQPASLSTLLEQIEKKRGVSKSIYNLQEQQKLLYANYYQKFITKDQDTLEFFKNFENQNTNNTLWNLDEKQRKVLVKMLQSPKPVGNNDIKEDWKNELDFLPFIFIAACLDPTLIDTEIAAMLDRLFALKKNDITDYSTKRLRYLLAMNDPKEKDKSKKNPFLEPELEYFFDLMRKEKLSKNQIKDLLTK